MKKISYLITETSSFIYHILAQIDAQKEWGAANLFNEAYKSSLKQKSVFQKHEEELLVKVYGPLSFFCLDTKYQKIEELLSDILNHKTFNKLLSYFNEKELNAEEIRLLCNVLSREQKKYQVVWEEKQQNYFQRVEIFEKISDEPIKKYLDFLDNLRLGKKMPDKIAIYLIDALGKKGRGLWYGCAVGLPNNTTEAKDNTIQAMHELTHNYTDYLLESYHYPIAVKPTDIKNHLRKEYVVDYFLQLYLNKNQVFKKTYNFQVDLDLIPEEIKNDPRLAVLSN